MPGRAKREAGPGAGAPARSAPRRRRSPVRSSSPGARPGAIDGPDEERHRAPVPLVVQPGVPLEALLPGRIEGEPVLVHHHVDLTRREESVRVETRTGALGEGGQLAGGERGFAPAVEPEPARLDVGGDLAPEAVELAPVGGVEAFGEDDPTRAG